MAATINIGGIAFPVSDFETIANAVIGGVKNGKSFDDILKSIEPGLLPIAETAAAAFIPYGGLILSLAAFVYSKSIPFNDLPQAEQNRILDMQGSHGDGAA